MGEEVELEAIFKKMEEEHYEILKLELIKCFKEGGDFCTTLKKNIQIEGIFLSNNRINCAIIEAVSKVKGRKWNS